MTWSLQPRGYLSISAIIYGLLFIPFITAVIAAYTFMRSQYRILYNQFGVVSKEGYQSFGKDDDDDRSFGEKLGFPSHKQTEIIGWPEDKDKRRKVLIATLEYEITDWELKVTETRVPLAWTTCLWPYFIRLGTRPSLQPSNATQT